MGRALEVKPPLPVGPVDIAPIVALGSEIEPSEPGYAWERLPGWIAEVMGVYDNIGNRPIIGVDLCSSIPVYAQILRAHEFSRDGARAAELARSLFSDEVMPQLKTAGLAPISRELAKDRAAKALLGSAIQETLYTITAPAAERKEKGLNEVLYSELLLRLLEQDVSYEEYHVGSDLHFNTTHHPQTYFEAVSAVRIPSADALAARARLATGRGWPSDRLLAQKATEPVGEERAFELIEWQAAHLTRTIAGNKRYRPARFFSFDAASPRDIAVSSLANTPQATQELDIYSHAVGNLFDRDQHIQGNVFEELPFPDESLALITCFDGWPFDFQLDESLHTNHEDFGQVALEMLEGFYRKLSPGGKLVIFPWGVHTQSHLEKKAAQRVMDGVVAEFARRVGHGVDKKVLHRETLHGWMSSADRETSELNSPVFNLDDDHFVALVVTKPKSSSLRNRDHSARVGNSALTAAQIQD